MHCGGLTCSSSSSSSSMVDTVIVLYFDPISLVYRRIITYTNCTSDIGKLFYDLGGASTVKDTVTN